jgi:CheY-like chemotaxis protein
MTGRGELVLVVDDEPLIQQVTQTSLEASNYRVLLASTGIEAIAVYAEYQQAIAVVLMDMMMPVMDGVTAIRMLQKLNPDLKVIATSGLASNNQLTETLGPAVKAFLPKPYTPNELLASLQTVLQMTLD